MEIAAKEHKERKKDERNNTTVAKVCSLVNPSLELFFAILAFFRGYSSSVI
jgi:hypothetical protein